MSQRTWPLPQWVCEWLLTSAVISMIECGWHHLPGARLDILQNLVANTRKPRSATDTVWPLRTPPRLLTAADCAQLLKKTSAWNKGSVSVADSGWSPSRGDGRAGGVVASATALLDHTNF